METMELEVSDLTCRSCGTVARALQRVPGVSAVEVDVMRRMARVETDLFGAEMPAMVAALAAAGFGARPVATATQTNAHAAGSHEAEQQGGAALAYHRDGAALH
jgi:copper chaperone CopZ